ncbi:hypothetical protein AGMMS50276_10840 [Synergistales bacterium]|nr:hypothetical protein AGMMS50276_10840 [Synergistales bacterium]
MYTMVSGSIDAICLSNSARFSSDFSEYVKVFFICYLYLAQCVENGLDGTIKEFCEFHKGTRQASPQQPFLIRPY